MVWKKRQPRRKKKQIEIPYETITKKATNSSKTREQVGARIEDKEIVLKEDLVDEPVAETTETPVESAKEEAPAVETENPVVQETVDTVKEEAVETVKEEPAKEDKKEENK